jgi:hypothetical protein
MVFTLSLHKHQMFKNTLINDIFCMKNYILWIRRLQIQIRYRY